MKSFIELAGKWRYSERVYELTEFMTVFENEEAVRLLNYFASYKHLIGSNENETVKNDILPDAISVGVLPQPEELTLK